jgi:hypothetical protein
LSAFDEVEIGDANMRPTKTIQTYWEQPPLRALKAAVLDIGAFDARGMKPVFGRADHYLSGDPLGFGDHGSELSFHLDMWLTRSGRLLARFWSRSGDTDPMSVEVTGFSPKLQLPSKGSQLDERWVPQCLRKAYADWIEDQM